MTHDDIKSAIRKVAGGPGHGMIKAAARRLDVSTKTVSTAYNGGAVSKGLANRIELELRRIAERDAETAIYGRAGTWSVGHVETRARVRDVVDEAVVTHLKTPIFIMHVSMIRGALLRYSDRGRMYPFRGYLQRMRTVTGVPSDVKRFLSAMRI